MIAELIHRKQLKSDMKALLAEAEVCPKRFLALYMGLTLLINLVSSLVNTDGVLGTFISIFASLLQVILGAGFVMYCMAVRRGERAEYLTLFDGFSLAGKIIALQIVTYTFIMLWSMLFVVPGIIAAYRYRFALYNLYENPDISIMEALNMSKRQTMGYKGQLFSLDLSYIGWIFLASIPSTIETSLLQQEFFASMDGMSVTLPAAPFSHAALPAWGWTALIGIWGIVVAMFYLPVYQCTELGYFEIAKRTSGVGAGLEPGLPDDESF